MSKGPLTYKAKDRICICDVSKHHATENELVTIVEKVERLGGTIKISFRLTPFIPRDKKFSDVTWDPETSKWFYHRDGYSADSLEVEVEVIEYTDILCKAS